VVEVAGPAERVAAAVECFMGIRIERDGTIVVRHGALELTGLQQQRTAGHEDKPEVRPQRDRLIVLLQGAVAVVAHFQDAAAPDMRIGTLGRVFDRVLEIRDRQIELLLLPVRNPAIEIGLPGTRIEPQRLGEIGERPVRHPVAAIEVATPRMGGCQILRAALGLGDDRRTGRLDLAAAGSAVRPLVRARGGA
jgi:hypothetical protein